MCILEVAQNSELTENIPTIFVLQGLPGSGKSTWSRNKMTQNPRTLVVCRDDLRKMVRGGVYVFDEELELAIMEMDMACLDICLRLGFDVIVDETNVSKRRRLQILSLVTAPTPVRTVCVVLDGGGNNLDNRMTDARGYDREHWAGVIEKLRAITEPVEENEGFDKIVYAKSPVDCLDV